MCLVVEWSPGAVLDGWEVEEACTGVHAWWMPVKGPCLLQRKAVLLLAPAVFSACSP